MPATVRAQVPIAAFSSRTAAEIRVIARRFMIDFWWRSEQVTVSIGANLFQVHFEPINRMRAVTALPSVR